MVAKERIANKKDRKGKKRTTMFLSGAGKKKQDPGGGRVRSGKLRRHGAPFYGPNGNRISNSLPPALYSRSVAASHELNLSLKFLVKLPLSTQSDIKQAIE
jgi:hypothetical protein